MVWLALQQLFVPIINVLIAFWKTNTSLIIFRFDSSSSSSGGSDCNSSTLYLCDTPLAARRTPSTASTISLGGRDTVVEFEARDEPKNVKLWAWKRGHAKLMSVLSCLVPKYIWQSLKIIKLYFSRSIKAIGNNWSNSGSKTIENKKFRATTKLSKTGIKLQRIPFIFCFTLSKY
jgi:hypothetical protein